MKTLTRLMSAGAVLAAGAVSLAADCPNSGPRRVVYGTNNAPVARYSYRSGYMGAVVDPVVAPVTTMAPRQGMSPYSYTANSASLGPEMHLDYARARQSIRGW